MKNSSAFKILKQFFLPTQYKINNYNLCFYIKNFYMPQIFHFKLVLSQIVFFLSRQYYNKYLKEFKRIINLFKLS